MADPLFDLFSQGLKVPVDELSDDSSPDNTPQWDSLAAMNLVSLIEDTFEVELSTRDIMQMRSIGLARQALKDKGVESI